MYIDVCTSEVTENEDTLVDDVQIIDVPTLVEDSGDTKIVVW